MRALVQVFSFDVVSKVFLGILGIVIIRYMPEDQYARYTLAISVVTVVTSTLASSFNRVYVVGYERLGLKSALSSFIGLQIWCIAILVVLTFHFRSHLDGVYWFVVALAFAKCLSDFCKTAFQQQLKFLPLSIIELARSVLFAVVLMTLIYVVGYHIQAWQALLAQALALFCVFFVALGRRIEPLALLKVGQTARLAGTVIRGEYRYLFGYFFVLAFFSQTDVFMLDSLGTKKMLATYGSALRYYTLLLLALNAVHVVLLPLISQVRTVAELDEIYAKQLKMVMVFAPLALLGGWLAQWIMPWADKGKYPGAVPVFRILAVSAIISFLFSPHANVVMRFNDFKFLFLLIGGGLLLNVALNFALIPPLAEIGAAGATLIAAGGVNFLTFLRARKHRLSLSLGEELHAPH